MLQHYATKYVISLGQLAVHCAPGVPRLELAVFNFSTLSLVCTRMTEYVITEPASFSNRKGAVSVIEIDVRILKHLSANSTRHFAVNVLDSVTTYSVAPNI